MAIGRHRCSCSGIVNADLDRSGLVGKAARHFAVELLVGKLFHHGLEQTRLDHVEGGAVVAGPTKARCAGL